MEKRDRVAKQTSISTKATAIPASPPKMEVYANDKKKMTKGYVFLVEKFC